MGEPALKSHASRKKHQTESVAIEQKEDPLGENRVGNFTVFREPIKHNKICPKKVTKQCRNIVGIKISNVTLFLQFHKGYCRHF